MRGIFIVRRRPWERDAGRGRTGGGPGRGGGAGRTGKGLVITYRKGRGATLWEHGGPKTFLCTPPPSPPVHLETG